MRPAAVPRTDPVRVKPPLGDFGVVLAFGAARQATTSSARGRYQAAGNPIRVAEPAFVVADTATLAPPGIGPAAGATFSELHAAHRRKSRSADRRYSRNANGGLIMTDDPKPTAYSLVPWVRRGLASRVSGTPTKNYAELPVALSVNNAAVTTPMPQIRLLGPGDITSIDASAVIRTDPRDGADAFEPNYLAMVELAPARPAVVVHARGARRRQAAAMDLPGRGRARRRR